MMNYSLFQSLNKSKVKEIYFNCPSCGEKCKISDDKCTICSYDLKEFKNIIFFGYWYYLEAKELTNNGDYFEALISISKFIGIYQNDENGYKLYIYILSKLGKYDKVAQELEMFEKKFPMNPWIIEVEKVGVENLSLPKENVQMPIIENDIDGFSLLTKEYLSYRIKNTNELIDFTLRFFDLISLIKKKTSNTKMKRYQNIFDFYEKTFLSFISKKEIRIESFDSMNYNDLSEEDNARIDVIGEINDKNLPNGYIKTVYPGIYLRSKLVSKQHVQINKRV